MCFVVTQVSVTAFLPDHHQDIKPLKKVNLHPVFIYISF